MRRMRCDRYLARQTEAAVPHSPLRGAGRPPDSGSACKPNTPCAVLAADDTLGGCWTALDEGGITEGPRKADGIGSTMRTFGAEAARPALAVKRPRSLPRLGRLTIPVRSQGWRIERGTL